MRCSDWVSPTRKISCGSWRRALADAAQRELAGFDGTMAAHKAAPLIFWAWARQLTVEVFSDEVGATLFERSLENRGDGDALEGVLERDDAYWCDQKGTPALETCAQQIDAAFARALEELQARWFELRTPVGGDTFTVNVSRVGLRPSAKTNELYLDEHGPSLRAIYDLGAPRIRVSCIRAVNRESRSRRCTAVLSSPGRGWGTCPCGPGRRCTH